MAFRSGRILNYVGDEQTGKTLFALTAIATNINSGYFDNYRFVYDDAEHALYKIKDEFGEKVKKNLEIIKSVTVQDFYANIMDQFKKKGPFFYVLDSLDQISTDEEKEVHKKLLKRRNKKEKLEVGDDEEKSKGSYGTQKARVMSNLLASITDKLEKTDSFLMILSQTRQTIGFAAKFKPKTRNGGKALDFAASYICWLSRIGKIKKNNIQIGNEIGIKPTKNKNKSTYYTTDNGFENNVIGKIRDVETIILNEIGLDDIGTNCNFLVNNGYWAKVKKEKEGKEKEGQKYLITDFGDPVELFKKDIPYFIEENNHEEKLKELCEKEWLKIEDSMLINRKNKWKT